MRAARESAARQRAADADKPGTLGWVLEQIDQRHGGIIPDWRTTQASGNFWLQKAVRRYGGAKQLAPLLYPRAVSLLPYYLAILIHTAGNPEAIALVSAKLIEPASGLSAYATDPDTGLTVRYWRTSDGTNDTHLHRFDVVYGTKMVDSRRGVRLSGT